MRSLAWLWNGLQIGFLRLHNSFKPDTSGTLNYRGPIMHFVKEHYRASKGYRDFIVKEHQISLPIITSVDLTIAIT